jgi:hypothetical protein
MLIPDWIRENCILKSYRLVEILFFVLLIWPVWGLNPGLFGCKVNTAEINGPSRQLVWAKKCRSHVICHSLANVWVWNIPMEITKFRIKFINFTKNKTLVTLRLTQMFRFFRFFITVCFGSENPKFWITVYPYPIIIYKALKSKVHLTLDLHGIFSHGFRITLSKKCNQILISTA